MVEEEGEEGVEEVLVDGAGRKRILLKSSDGNSRSAIARCERPPTSLDIIGVRHCTVINIGDSATDMQYDSVCKSNDGIVRKRIAMERRKKKPES